MIAVGCLKITNAKDYITLSRDYPNQWSSCFPTDSHTLVQLCCTKSIYEYRSRKYKMFSKNSFWIL